jgi:DNA-binding XRE family transcriptional regulator
MPTTPPSLTFLPRRRPSATDPDLFTGRLASDPPTAVDADVQAVAHTSTELPATEEEYRRQIGRRARLARIALDLTQDEVAIRAGLTRNYVSATERGAQGLDIWRLRWLAVALAVNPAWLLGLD